jgi:hypothetical protein
VPEASRYKDDTIVIAACDNRFQAGERNHWLKFALSGQTAALCRMNDRPLKLPIDVPGRPAGRAAPAPAVAVGG